MVKEKTTEKNSVKNQILRTMIIILIVSAIATVQYIATTLANAIFFMSENAADDGAE